MRPWSVSALSFFGALSFSVSAHAQEEAEEVFPGTLEVVENTSSEEDTTDLDDSSASFTEELTKGAGLLKLMEKSVKKQMSQGQWVSVLPKDADAADTSCESKDVSVQIRAQAKNRLGQVSLDVPIDVSWDAECTASERSWYLLNWHAEIGEGPILPALTNTDISIAVGQAYRKSPKSKVRILPLEVTVTLTYNGLLGEGRLIHDPVIMKGKGWVDTLGNYSLPSWMAPP